MIVVTGGAGFIGSNIVRALNDQGRSDVLVVDELERGRKLLNLVDCEIADLLDKDRFLERLLSGDDLGAPVEAIIHEGACSDTAEWDGRYVMATNYDYPKALLGSWLTFWASRWPTSTRFCSPPTRGPGSARSCMR